MKTKLIYFIHSVILLFLLLPQAHAQTIVTSGSSLVIVAGGKLVSMQNVVLHNGGNLGVDGTLELKKDFLNQNDAEDYLGTGTLQFTGSVNQNITGQNTMENLTVNNPAGISLGGAARVNSTMILQNGKVTLGSNSLTIGINAVFGGSPSVLAMIVPTGTGKVIKEFAIGYTGPFTFPVGDTTGTADYSPVSLSFTQVSTANSGFVGLNLANSKYPDPGITGNYLNRYWNLTSWGFNSFNCNATFQYVPADVTGTEAILSCSRVNPLPWVTYGLTNPATHQLSATGVTGFSSFTGLKSSTTPANQELANIDIGSGLSNCYDATNVLTVAGNGKTFVVNNGGSALLIAGQKISILSGTRVFSGGYLHGTITTDNHYCASLPNPLVNNPVAAPGVMAAVPEQMGDNRVKVYPNPTCGIFTIELAGSATTGLNRIEIYNMNGVKVIVKNLHGEQKFQCSGSDLMPGIYFIRACSENKVETIKLIKK
jgi:hypothetical protein